MELFERICAPKPTAFLPMRFADDLVEPGERAAADEQDVRRVDREELLVRMLAPALRRHARRPFPRGSSAAPAARPRQTRRA